jgi:hypothetical protein
VQRAPSKEIVASTLDKEPDRESLMRMLLGFSCRPFGKIR